MAAQPKELVFEEEARKHLFKGIDQLARVVAFTLGPKGRNVSLEKSWGAPKITNDGGSIVSEISLENEYENMGVSIAKEVVQKLKEKCGDGTTTGTLLLRALVEHGLKLVSSGLSPIGLKRGMDQAVHAIEETIDRNVVRIHSQEEIENVATASASGDREIGKIIAQAVKKGHGANAISIEDGKGVTTEIEEVQGMQFDRGFASPYFCTDTEKMKITMHGAQILLADKKIATVHEILPILQAVAASGRELLIIAEEFDAEVLSTLVINKLRGVLKVAAVKAPGFGDRRKAVMQDIAVITGATVISDDAGISFKDLSPAMLGSANEVTITKENTTLVDGSGSEEAVKARIKQIEREIEEAKNSYDKEKLQERRGKLLGGVTVIRVGAVTETEAKEKKQRYEDSLNATRAAIEEGIVPGGGVALLTASRSLPALSGDEAAGTQIVRFACETLLKQIAMNSGLDGGVVLHEVLHSPKNYGFNAVTGKVEDLLGAGVIDPAKVVKSALRYAASAAGIVLLSEVLITDAQEDNG